MKKPLAIVLILVISLIPAVAFSQDSDSLEEIYIGTDDQLAQYIEDYADLLETREEKIEEYENMYLSRGSSYNHAKSLAMREKSILQVDYNIENKLDAIKAREVWLSVDFRNSIVNLYAKYESALDAAILSFSAKGDYADSKKSNQLGYISDNDLLKIEYNTKESENNANFATRLYESTLRSFNYKIGNPLETEDYDYDFSEEIVKTLGLDFYISHALDNAPVIKTAVQNLSKYYIDQKYFDQYSFSTGLTYIKEALRILEINTRLQEINLEETKKNLIDNITDDYKALVIEREKLNLAELNIKILQNEYEINYSLYNRGFIDKEELSESADKLNEAKHSKMISIYKYNTQVKSFENKCAYYPKEGNGQ